MVSLVFLVENTSFEKIDKLSKQGVPVNLIFEQYNIDDSIKLLENNFNINILVSPTTSNNYDLINMNSYAENYTTQCLNNSTMRVYLNLNSYGNTSFSFILTSFNIHASASSSSSASHTKR